LLDDLEQLKAKGLTGAAEAIIFCLRLIQPLQDRAHLAFEYWGKYDPTRVVQRKVSKAEMMARAKNIIDGRIRSWECPKALGCTVPPTRYVVDLDMHPSKVFERLLLLS
jgi:hypothetical protein